MSLALYVYWLSCGIKAMVVLVVDVVDYAHAEKKGLHVDLSLH